MLLYNKYSKTFFLNLLRKIGVRLICPCGSLPVKYGKFLLMSYYGCLNLHALKECNALNMHHLHENIIPGVLHNIAMRRRLQEMEDDSIEIQDNNIEAEES